MVESERKNIINRLQKSKAMNINEATKKEKLDALIDWVTHMDEQAMDDTLKEFLGWSDDLPTEDLKED